MAPWRYIYSFCSMLMIIYGLVYGGNVFVIAGGVNILIAGGYMMLMGQKEKTSMYTIDPHITKGLDKTWNYTKKILKYLYERGLFYVFFLFGIWSFLGTIIYGRGVLTSVVLLFVVCLGAYLLFRDDDIGEKDKKRVFFGKQYISNQNILLTGTFIGAIRFAVHFLYLSFFHWFTLSIFIAGVLYSIVEWSQGREIKTIFRSLPILLCLGLLISGLIWRSGKALIAHRGSLFGERVVYQEKVIYLPAGFTGENADQGALNEKDIEMTYSGGVITGITIIEELGILGESKIQTGVALLGSGGNGCIVGTCTFLGECVEVPENASCSDEENHAWKCHYGFLEKNGQCVLSCGSGYCPNGDDECVSLPSNATCNIEALNGWECSEGRERRLYTCEKVLEEPLYIPPKVTPSIVTPKPTALVDEKNEDSQIQETESSGVSIDTYLNTSDFLKGGESKKDEEIGETFVDNLQDLIDDYTEEDVEESTNSIAEEGQVDYEDNGQGTIVSSIADTPSEEKISGNSVSSISQDHNAAQEEKPQNREIDSRVSSIQ